MPCHEVTTLHRMTQNLDRRTYTVTEAAERLGRTPETVRRYVRRGVLPAWVDLGGLIRVDAEAVDSPMRPYPTGATS